ncbi:MAG: ThiF family adenylyltransferase [Thermoplasmata archaeon]|nr:MAG: ThiF family adenylyltransferase [Thermoplasmata archaeon]
MSHGDRSKKRVKVVLPSVSSFEVEYEDEEELKNKICSKLEIEPELTNLIFVKKDEEEASFEEDIKPSYEVIVDYIWARQMISLGDRQKKLRKANALVVGAGALGNEIVKNLAYLGFGTIKIVDYDTVELSNVSRSLFKKEDVGRNKAEVLAKKIKENSPYTKIESIPKRIEECDEQKLNADVILSGLDNMPARVWLASFCVKNSTPLVDGGISEFQGRVQTYLPDGACLACTIPLDRYAEIMELSNPCDGYDVGAVASFSSVASIVGGVQANEAMKIVCGLPTLKGVLLMDFLNNNYSVLPLERNDSCFVCGKEIRKDVKIQ